MLRQRHLFIRNPHIRRLHRQIPVLKVVVQIEALVQQNLLESIQQTKGEVYNRLVWPEYVVKVTDVHCQILQRRLSKYGAVVAEEGGLSAVQVDLCVVGLSPAG